MKLKLDFNIDPFPFNVSHNDNVVLLGSCFSDEIGRCLEREGFMVSSNPFGTLFHPLAISNALLSSLNQDVHLNVFRRNDLYLSWDSASKLFATSSEGLKKKVIDARASLKADVQKAKLLIVTFGTAKGYRHIENDQLVGNCHKAPPETFTSELTKMDEIVHEWKNLIAQLKKGNPGLEIVFTVSPVRHKKDGLAENNRSKAQLIEAVHQLKELSGVHYFPSYEILIDELRDYRFYANDLVHPSGQAVEYIWSKFSKSVFNVETQRVSKKVELIKIGLNHRALFPGSIEDQERLEKLRESQKELSSLYSSIVW